MRSIHRFLANGLHLPAILNDVRLLLAVTTTTATATTLPAEHLAVRCTNTTHLAPGWEGTWRDATSPTG